MIGKLEQKIESLRSPGGANKGGGGRRCYKCGSTEHVIRDCPEGGTKKDTNPRFIPPNTNKGEPKEKTVDGVKHIWCGKCRGGKGIWTVGARAHHTHEHRGNSSGNDDGDLPKETVQGDATAGTIQTTQANVGYVDEPLVFGFLGWNRVTDTENDDSNEDDFDCDDDDFAPPLYEDPFDEDYPKGCCGEL